MPGAPGKRARNHEAPLCCGAGRRRGLRVRPILLIGRNGQLGSELAVALRPLGPLVALGRAELDLAAPRAIAAVVRATRPGWIVNAAAYTSVDRAEHEPELAFAVNGIAAGLLAHEARAADARLIHFSTDYVFDGHKPAPYDESDHAAPLSVYGRSKLDGEQRVRAAGAWHWIFRTSWLYGLRGGNFLAGILQRASRGEALRVAADQAGAPTWNRAVAHCTAAAIARARAVPSGPGTFHVTAAGATSRHGFAEAIVALARARSLCPDVPVHPIAAADYPAAARRPLNSRLSGEHLSTALGLRLRPWHESLVECLDELAASA